MAITRERLNCVCLDGECAGGVEIMDLCGVSGGIVVKVRLVVAGKVAIIIVVCYPHGRSKLGPIPILPAVDEGNVMLR